MLFKRLFEQFIPENYQLHLDLDKEKLKFSGHAKITGLLPKKSSQITLHSNNLVVKLAKINGVNCTFEHGQNDELTITSPTELVGKNELSILFTGKITKPMHGLYPCFAKNNDVILATQFESHHAREVFPCIDEPEAKATFNLSLKTSPNETVLSNMPILAQTTEDNKLVTSFEQSPVMSTYLLAFVVGNLQPVSGTTKGGVAVNVWSSKDHDKKHLDFALDTAIKVTEFLNNYFGADYPLPKCDHVALPDFSNGAMENWGLITYREVCLLVDPKKTSTATKEYAATVIAHELSHQWFGNLVTMKWWDDLWLNESFATLMEYIAIDNIYPEWDIMLTFAAHEALSAMRRDVLPGVQAVATAVDHPDQISTLFDPSIVYAKGARLLLMAHGIVGEKAFRSGLKQYFQKHAYQNTTGKDLWAALSRASGKDVSRVMEAWVKQPGFPLLTIKSNAGGLQISQSKFRGISDKTASNALWPIPLFAKPKQPLEILSTPQAQINCTEKDIVFNTKGAHYSVHYKDKESIQKIKALVGAGKLPAAQRLLLINDLSVQAKAGIGSIVDVLGMLDAYRSEQLEPVWSVLAISIAEARKLVEGNELAEQQLKDFVYSYIKPLYTQLGWRKIVGENPNDTKLREIILGLAVYTERPEIISKVTNLYTKSKPANLPADTRHIVMGAAVKFGDRQVFDDLFAQYPHQTNSDLQGDIAGALTSTKNKELAKHILRNLKNQEWVRLQDVDRFVAYLLQNKYTRATAWKWLTSNWAWVEKNFATDKSYDNYPRYAAGAFGSTAWLKEYKAFFDPKKHIPVLTRNIALGEADIKAKVNWQKRDHKALAKWLNEANLSL